MLLLIYEWIYSVKKKKNRLNPNVEKKLSTAIFSLFGVYGK